MTHSVFSVIEPQEAKRVAIVLSSPHSGTAFPQDLQPYYQQSVVASAQDTDWFVDQLYDFAPSMGITFITAHYSRFVVDLNRAADALPLYDDERFETTVVPTTDFSGKPIYRDGYTPSVDEIKQRLERYHQPYYARIEQALSDLRQQFPRVLFFDAHSIKDCLPSISKTPFPHLILGNQDGKTCDQQIIDSAHSSLTTQSDWQVRLNYPFKGGNLTRFFGNPEAGIHSLQLEMTQSLYMDENQLVYNSERASRVRSQLIKMFESLIDTV